MNDNDPLIIVALDYPSLAPLRAFVAQLSPRLCRLKIGNILFTRYGPALVEELMQQGFEVFLDLKFHDIPQTVAQSCRAAADLGVWMINLHVSSGFAAMQAAREAVDQSSNNPLLIGVTVLTSLQSSDLEKLGNQRPLADLVLDLAKQAQTCGLDGVVCSSQEASLLRQHLGDKFLLVTPGIRPEKMADDQRRVLTPCQARAAGASYLVIGRPITQAKNPLAMLQVIADSLETP